MKRTILFIATIALVISCGEKKEITPIITPTPEQVEWANCEIGVMYHFDMPTYVPNYNFRKWGTHPDPKVFNPTELDTDQWLEAAQKIGAKYAVLVAKHCSGFTLWPSKSYDYGVAQSPWKDGKGDIVADFIASCKKYNIRPGIYASASANGFCWVDNPGVVQQGSPYTQQEYIEIVETQLSELWGNYGDLFEVWFDGGVLAVADGGPDIPALAQKYQPNTIAFQGAYGMKNLIRWVGNEEGFSPDPCWSTADSTTSSGGTVKVEGMHGNPQGPFWCPGEADFTLRHNNSFQGGWFWGKGEDDKIFTVEELMTKYCSSVGRNTNMLVGVVVDNRGLVPQVDMERLAEWGEAIMADFSKPIALTEGSGKHSTIEFDTPQTTKYIVLREDIAQGERVLEYSVRVLENDTWRELFKGTNIGNKRIIKTDEAVVNAVEVIVDKSKAEPMINEIAIY